MQDEKIECCRFSRDGMKPFLFCTVAKGMLSMSHETNVYAYVPILTRYIHHWIGTKVVTVVWNISDWARIGYKRLLGKPVSTLSVSMDGKFLAL
jgi:prolactin regulatory element-binding protein